MFAACGGLFEEKGMAGSGRGKGCLTRRASAEDVRTDWSGAEMERDRTTFRRVLVHVLLRSRGILGRGRARRTWL